MLNKAPGSNYCLCMTSQEFELTCVTARCNPLSNNYLLFIYKKANLILQIA